jgi:adenylate cyclase
MTVPTRLSRWFAELRRRKVVRVTIAYLIATWVLIQVAAETFGPLGLPDWSVKLVIVITVLGFPISLILAWAFDVTPRGIERAVPADATQPSAADEANPPVPPIAKLAAVTPPPMPSREGANRSVAVLPFVDMSAERDQDYFCEGVAEEIGNALCYVRGLEIASRTSAFQFKGKAADVREIGRRSESTRCSKAAYASPETESASRRSSSAQPTDITSGRRSSIGSSRTCLRSRTRSRSR